MEELFTIELTTSQLKTLKDALVYARLFYSDKKYLTPEFENLTFLTDAIEMQTLQGVEI